jgi:ubiquinol oxidase
LHLAAIASATAFVVPDRRHALTRRAARDDGDTITQLIDAKEAELADADAVTTTKTTTTMPNYVDQANYFDGDRPAPAWELAQTNFLKQGATILGQIGESVGLQKRDPGAVPASLGLVLSNEAVTEAERKREASGGRVDAHPVSRKLYDVGCLFLDTLFDERPIQRFWFLEVIARIPYFSYVSMLHLYESFGWWRGPELRKVHNAEEWNELHHLLIMEALGGNSLWSDRFLGYHVAIGYYWILNVVFFFSPRIAYQFMELLEAHAVDTYGTFVVQNRERLAELPAPDVATSYYSSGDLYLFDDFQVSTPPETRRPDCETLLDVFTNIAIDEGEHVKTMQACQDYARIGARVVSPHMDGAHAAESREKWVRWAAEVNEAAKH